MSLYRLIYDNDDNFVEAETFSEAIELWRAVKRVEWGEDFQLGDEPYSCQLIYDKPVIRAGSLEAELATEEAEIG